MKSSTLYRIMRAVGIGIMISAFAVISDSYPWYYEVLLFDVGLAMWLIAKWQWKKSQPNQSGDDPLLSGGKKINWLFVLSVIVMLAGALHVFVDNESVLHDPLQLIFAAGALSMAFTMIRIKRAAGVLALVLLSLSAQSQDYTMQVNALKKSFESKDVVHVQPFLSKDLAFNPMPIENTTPILNNIVTRLPYVGMEVVKSADSKATVKYEFKGLGERTSAIHFNADGKIVRIELIENLIQMEMEQRRQMQASVQQPGTNEVVKKYPPTSVTITADDGVTISGNLYEIDKEAPVILLCHQAGYNKAEYTDIAPRLNEMGFNCLAIDQRSGGTFAGQQNETAGTAMEMGQEPTMLDARQDLKAAIDYLAKKYKQKVIVWGSSYSSSLALFELAENKKVKAAMAFSPGDYFGNDATMLSSVFGQVDKPYLVTSSKTEAETLKKSLEGVKMKNNQMHFIPESNGFHGSRVLWIGQEGADEYWSAVTEFLTALK